MQNSLKLRCVTFDLDDTLWDCAPVIEKAEQALFEWMRENWPRVARAHSVESLREHRMTVAQQRPDLGHDMTALRLHALEQIAEEFGYPLETCPVGLSLMRHHRNQVALYEDVKHCFMQLRSAGLSVGAISNGNADLAAIGIDDLFDFSVFSAEVGVSKPHARVFAAAADRAGLSTREMVHVGDDPANDVLGASGSGMRAIWYNPAYKAWPGGQSPDAVIRSLRELPPLLAGWAQSRDDGSGKIT